MNFLGNTKMLFYFAKFEHKKTGKVFYKFGVTGNAFETRMDPNRHFPDRKGYNDFNITLVNSIVASKENTTKIEKYFLKKYPKNLFLERYLELPFGHYNGIFTGITEIVKLDDNEVQRINEKIDKIKDYLS